MAKTRTGDPVAFLRDDVARDGGLGMAVWGFAAVISVVLGYASWQFHPPRDETLVTRALTPDGEDATGSIATEETGGASTAVRPVGGAKVAPLVLGASEQQPTMRDIVQIRADLRDLQRRIAQMGLAGDGVSRRLDRLEARLDTAAHTATPHERTAADEAPAAARATSQALAKTDAAPADAVRIPQPRPEADLPAVTGSVPAKAAAAAAPGRDDREPTQAAADPPKAVTTASVPMGPIAALDLGGHRSLAALKKSWTDMSGRYAEFGGGIEPLARLNETEAGIEARLVVGPYPNPTEASKACVRLRTLGVACAVTGYTGQSLAAIR